LNFVNSIVSKLIIWNKIIQYLKKQSKGK
jgi:hypothetical protein